MRTEMVMPQMGESIAEATILKWRKGVGDAVEKDETILEISTDKVDSEIPAPASGVIVELKAKEGDTVPVKSVIALIETDKAQAQSAPKAEPKKEAKKEAPKPVATAPVTPAATTARQPQKTPVAPAQSVSPPPAIAMSESGERISHVPSHVGEQFFSPLVRSLSAQYGISPLELASIRGTGAHGRVTKADVMTYLQYRHSGSPTGSYGGPAQVNGRNQQAKGSDLPAPATRPAFGPDGLRVEEMDNMRKRIAEHMVRSKATSAHVYSTAEVDVSRITKWRENNQSAFLAREGFKLSFTPFFLEAAIKALIQFPYVNASIEGEKIILKKPIHLGCAVALGTTGLIVPVIKNADQLNFAGIARALNDLANRARGKTLTQDDISGGTFTVTNPGVFGNIIGCPIINQPQVAILSVGAIKKRPVVVEDMIGIREIVYLTLSYDHRLVDGSLGGQFLQYISKYLEQWDLNRSFV